MSGAGGQDRAAGSTPRERAAARGLRFEPIGAEPPLAVGPDLCTLLGVLDGVAADIRSGQDLAHVGGSPKSVCGFAALATAAPPDFW